MPVLTMPLPMPVAARPPRRTRTLVRIGATTLAAGALVLLSGAVAQAHVQVIADQTAAGSENTKLTFRVPTESVTASTVGLKISLPTATPLAEVLAEPVPGWTVSVQEGKLPKPVVLDGTTLTEAPSTVTWTAARGHGVPPGGFQEFALSAGPIPQNATVLSFPAVQTYSDGTVVSWNQPQPPGAAEPEHPVPHFTVTAALPDDDAVIPTATAAPGEPSASVASAQRAEGTTKVSDTLGRSLGAAGLGAGLLGLLLGGLAWRRAGGRA